MFFSHAIFFLAAFSQVLDSSTTSPKIKRKAIREFENNLNTSIGMLYLGQPYSVGIPEQYRIALNSVESADTRVASQFFNEQPIQKNHIIGAIVGRCIYRMFVSNDGNYPWALKFGVWLSSNTILLDSQASPTEILSINWTVYELPKILDLTEVLGDVRLYIAGLIIKAKHIDIAGLISTSFSNNDMSCFKKWNKSFGAIFRHSSHEDLLRLIEMIRSNNLENDLWNLFSMFPYFSMGKLTLELFPGIESRFSLSKPVDQILEIVKTGEIGENALNDEILQIAALDFGKTKSISTLQVQQAGINHLSLKYLHTINFYSNSLFSWMEQLLPHRFDHDLLNRSIPLMSDMLLQLPFDNLLSPIILKRVMDEILKNDDNSLLMADEAKDSQTENIVIFVLALMYPFISSAKAMLPIQVLSDFSNQIPIDEKKYLIINLSENLKIHHFKLLAQIISKVFLDHFSSDKDKSVVQQLVVYRLLICPLVKYGKTAHENIIINQWTFLVKRYGESLGKEVFDQISSNFWSIYDIAKLLKAINMPDITFDLISDALDDRKRPWYATTYYQTFNLVINMLDHWNALQYKLILSNLFYFCVRHSNHLNNEAPGWRLKLINVANEYLAKTDQADTYHRMRRDYLARNEHKSDIFGNVYDNEEIRYMADFLMVLNWIGRLDLTKF